MSCRLEGGFLLTADLHFVASERESYRFGIFDTLSAVAFANDLRTLFILGDLTEQKYGNVNVNAQFALVNKISDRLCGLLADDVFDRIVILRGNHDFIDPAQPFFRFLRYTPNIHFVTAPEVFDWHRGRILCLPYVADPETEWKHVNWDAAFVFCHQTFAGATSNGIKLSGVPIKVFKSTSAEIWAGDIHDPQSVGYVQYVGSPYDTSFGENVCQRRIVMVDSVRNCTSVPVEFPRKRKVLVGAPEELHLCELSPGDEVRIGIETDADEIAEWPKTRKQALAIAEELEVIVRGCELVPAEGPGGLWISRSEKRRLEKEPPATILRRYCDHEGIDPAILNDGLALL